MSTKTLCGCFPRPQSADWTHCMTGASIIGGVSGVAVGVLSGNSPLAIVSGGLIFSGGVLGARVQYLQPIRELAQNVNTLGSTTTGLWRVEQGMNLNIAQLSSAEQALQNRLIHAMEEKSDFERRHVAHCEIIGRLQQQLDELQTQHDTLIADVSQMTQIFKQEERSSLDLSQATEHNFHDTLRTVAEQMSLLTRERENLTNEHIRLQNLIDSLKEEEIHLKRQLQEFEVFKTQLNTANELEEKIRNNTLRLEQLTASPHPLKQLGMK